jgi:putative membrane protein
VTILHGRTGSFLAVAIAALASAAPLHVAEAQAAKLDDPTIIAIFDAANTWDIATGALAVRKGTTKEVRDFGAMLERDHTAVRQQGRDLARKLGVHPTPPKDFAMAKDHEAAMKSLRAKEGKAFDRAFLEHEVAFHKAVIDAVTTTLLPSLKNEEARALVTKVAPAFQAHLIRAEQLERQLRATSQAAAK